MNNIELKDIGISRLEIRAAMRSNAKYQNDTRTSHAAGRKPKLD